MTGYVVTYRCDDCGREFAEGALRRVGPLGTAVSACPLCGRAVRREQSWTSEPLWKQLAGALGFPLRPTTLAGWVLLALVSGVVSLVPIVGTPLAAGLVLAFSFAILRESAAGADDLEISPEQLGARVIEWLFPLVRLVLVTLVAATPAMLAAWAMGVGSTGGLVTRGLALLGALWLPAGIIAIAHDDSFVAALNPIPATTFIVRVPGKYLLTLAFLGLASLAGATALELGRRIGTTTGVPLVALVTTRALALYTPIAMARMLGLLVRDHWDEI